jgi:hypothetical protein
MVVDQLVTSISDERRDQLRRGAAKSWARAGKRIIPFLLTSALVL